MSFGQQALDCSEDMTHSNLPPASTGLRCQRLLPNDPAQQQRGTGELDVPEANYAPPSAAAPGSARPTDPAQYGVNSRRPLFSRPSTRQYRRQGLTCIGDL